MKYAVMDDYKCHPKHNYDYENINHGEYRVIISLKALGPVRYLFSEKFRSNWNQSD